MFISKNIFALLFIIVLLESSNASNRKLENWRVGLVSRITSLAPTVKQLSSGQPNNHLLQNLDNLLTTLKSLTMSGKKFTKQNIEKLESSFMVACMEAKNLYGAEVLMAKCYKGWFSVKCCIPNEASLHTALGPISKVEKTNILDDKVRGIKYRVHVQ